MLAQFVLVTGMGLGEDSKGAWVEFVTEQLGAHTVIRSGGPQSCHHLVRPEGSIGLSHYGCGVFNHAKTHLVAPIIPTSLFDEAVALEAMGVANPFDVVTIDGNCLAVLPFYGAMSRLREILRSEKKGTVGLGVGEAITDSVKFPDLAIRAFEFGREDLVDKIDKVYRLKLSQAEDLLRSFGGTMPPSVYPELRVLADIKLPRLIAESYRLTAELFRITGSDQIDRILAEPGTVVSEASHGTLHHPRFGFVPHVTQIDPTAGEIRQLLSDRGYGGKVVRLGTCRSFIVRYGAGPLVSFDETMTREIEEAHNPDNEWLGKVRKGPLDLVAVKYSIKICGWVDGLLVSHLDVMNRYHDWPVCVAYRYDGNAADLDGYFEVVAGLITGIKLHSDGPGHYEHQLRLTQMLNHCQPVVVKLAATNSQTLEEVFIGYVESELGIPVMAVARGPKATDRKVREGWGQLFPNTLHK